MATPSLYPPELATMEGRRFRVIRHVPVFDEHEITRGGEVLDNIDRSRLEQIAYNCNQRDAIKQYAPLVIGHTLHAERDKDGRPLFMPREQDQPRARGYARNFRVEFNANLGRHVCYADFWVFEEDFAEASTYPRTSVEYFPHRDIFDPIALIRKTPMRDLGQWINSAREPVYRYAMEEEDDLGDIAPPGSPGTPSAPPVDGAPPEGGADGMGGMADLDSDGMADQMGQGGQGMDSIDPGMMDAVMKCVQRMYPHLERIHKQFADQYMAGGAAYPSATNAGGPPTPVASGALGATPPPVPEPEPSRMSAPQTPEQYQETIRALTKERDDARKDAADRAAKIERQARETTLADLNYRYALGLHVGEEMLFCESLLPQQFQAYCDRIIRHGPGRNDPSLTPEIPVDRGQPPPIQNSDPNRPVVSRPAGRQNTLDHEKVFAYIREHSCSYEEAEQAIRGGGARK